MLRFTLKDKLPIATVIN